MSTKRGFKKGDIVRFTEGLVERVVVAEVLGQNRTNGEVTIRFDDTKVPTTSMERRVSESMLELIKAAPEELANPVEIVDSSTANSSAGPQENHTLSGEHDVSMDDITLHKDSLELALDALVVIANGGLCSSTLAQNSPARTLEAIAAKALKDIKQLNQSSEKCRFPLPIQRSLSTTSNASPMSDGPPVLVRTSSTSSNKAQLLHSHGMQLLQASLQLSGLFSLTVCSAAGTTKVIANLNPRDTLLQLLDRIKDEFAIAGSEKLDLELSGHRFTKEDANRTLEALGIADGVQLSFVSATKDTFDVCVTTLDGRSVDVCGLLPDMNLATLISAVEQELQITGEESVSLIFDSVKFEFDDLGRTLDRLGLSDKAELTAYKTLRAKGTCPRCNCEHTVLRGVTIGATHEGWGRSWKTCKYDCSHCFVAIPQGFHVNTCKACKIFWHRSCKLLE